MKAPFPWFGGKSSAADLILPRFGDIGHYIEPFAGSLGVLLANPVTPALETVNDLDCFLANFWRAVQADPQGVQDHADYPVMEADLHARHTCLVQMKEDLASKLMGDPAFYDVKLAGWWVWGICLWIGSGWCAGKGPWVSHNGRFVHKDTIKDESNGEDGVYRKLPSLGNGGRGVFREGVNRQIPSLGGGGRGVFRISATTNTPGWDALALAERLKGVRVACGDWSRILGDSIIHSKTPTGILLDPPYDDGHDVYNAQNRVSKDVRAWCAEHGSDKELRIALCGYEGEHNALEALGWLKVSWKAKGGYGNQSDGGDARVNSERERIWFSPHCINAMSAVEMPWDDF